MRIYDLNKININFVIIDYNFSIKNIHTFWKNKKIYSIQNIIKSYFKFPKM